MYLHTSIYIYILREREREIDVCVYMAINYTFEHGGWALSHSTVLN